MPVYFNKQANNAHKIVVMDTIKSVAKKIVQRRLLKVYMFHTLCLRRDALFDFPISLVVYHLESYGISCKVKLFPFNLRQNLDFGNFFNKWFGFWMRNNFDKT